MTGYASSNGAGSHARTASTNRLLALSYIMALAMPPIGFGLGIVIAVRYRHLRSRHGAWIITISIVAALIWVLLIASGALDATSTTNAY